MVAPPTMSLLCCLWSQKTPVLCLFNGERSFAAAPTTIALRSAHRGETQHSPPCRSALDRSHGRPVSDCCRLLLLNSDHWFLNSSPKLLLDQRRRGHQLCQQLGRLSRYLRLSRHFGCYLLVKKSSHSASRSSSVHSQPASARLRL